MYHVCICIVCIHLTVESETEKEKGVALDAMADTFKSICPSKASCPH